MCENLLSHTDFPVEPAPLVIKLISTLTRKISRRASMAVKAFYPRVSRARPGTRISRYVAGPFTFTFVDESSLCRGELYTIVTNKDGHGGKGTLVAIIEGVKAVEVSRI